jgi:signal transduction histidine kinase
VAPVPHPLAQALRRALAVLLVAWPVLAWPQALLLRDATLLVPGSSPRAVVLPHAWIDDLPGFTGIARYALAFEAPQGDDLVGVLLTRSCSTAVVQVNGVLVGTASSLEPPWTSSCYHPQLFAVPRSLLQPQGNRLEVALAGHDAGEATSLQRSSGISAVTVGPMALLQAEHERLLLWTVGLSRAVSASMVAVALVLLALWLARRSERHVLHAALFSLVWGVMNLRLFVQQTGLPHRLEEVLWCAGFFAAGALAIQFMWGLLGRRWRWVDRALWIQAVAVLALLLAVPAGALLQVSAPLYALGGLQIAVSTAGFLVVARRERRGEFWLLGAVLLQAVAFIGLEVLQQAQVLPLPPLHFSQLGTPLVIAAVAGRMVQLFLRATHASEQLNRELEQRVQEKSREIDRGWREVAALRSEQAAQEERRRIASDLHDDLGARLLGIVQASQGGGRPEQIAELARQALDDMRLSVRGLTAQGLDTADWLADCRAETVARLTDAGLLPAWLAEEPPPGVAVPARAQVQLVRVLREAVSNVIRHSGARRCTVRIAFPPGWLLLEVEDDGRGLPPDAGSGPGLGLPGIQRRVALLGGAHHHGGGPDGGTRLRVSVPLGALQVRGEETA